MHYLRVFILLLAMLALVV
ncbi:unnamed protein product, partial [Allacma fusca]